MRQKRISKLPVVRAATRCRLTIVQDSMIGLEECQRPSSQALHVISSKYLQ
jgi:hypothetical protein